jgi:hypothetical protein
MLFGMSASDKEWSCNCGRHILHLLRATMWLALPAFTWQLPPLRHHVALSTFLPVRCLPHVHLLQTPCCATGALAPTCKEYDLLHIPTLDEGAHCPQPVPCLCVLLACQVEQTLSLGSLGPADNGGM